LSLPGPIFTTSETNDLVKPPQRAPLGPFFSGFWNLLLETGVSVENGGFPDCENVRGQVGVEVNVEKPVTGIDPC